MLIEPPSQSTQTPGNCYDTFNLLNQMGIDWRYDKRSKVSGRKKQDLGSYKTQSSFRIEDWNSKIHNMTEENLWEMIKEEERLEHKSKTNPSISQLFEKQTPSSYQKKLRNRIRALKLRIKKKEEDQELCVLRKMARRLNQLSQHNLMPKEHTEILREQDEHKFYHKLNKMRLKAGKTQIREENNATENNLIHNIGKGNLASREQRQA